MASRSLVLVVALALTVAIAASCKKEAAQTGERPAGEAPAAETAPETQTSTGGTQAPPATAVSPGSAVPPGAAVTTTPSGLKYVDILVGTGPSPSEGQTVRVHYTGWLKNGTEFDSSVTRDQPFTFPIGKGRVIKGWDEGVATMKVGGKRKLMIPPDLAYGESGAGGGLIPPNAELTFDVELLGIE